MATPPPPEPGDNAQGDPVFQAIQQRRTLLGQPPLQPGPQPQTWGLALSGGGVRSATFGAGLLVALARRGALLRFDLLSTVSGGGFIGALLGRLFDQNPSAQAAEDVQAAIADADNRWFTWWLRANGHYLFARGVRDVFVAVATMLRNLLALHIELAMVALGLGTLLAMVNLLTWGWLDGAWLPTQEGGAHTLNPWMGKLFSHLPNALPTLWLWWMPAMLVAAGTLACAYWALPQRRDGQTRVVAALHWLVWLVAMASLLWRSDWLALHGGLSTQMRLGAMLMSLCWLLGILWGWGHLGWHGNEVLARHRLTHQLSLVLRATAIFALLGLVDRLAWFIAFDLKAWLQLGAGLLALAALLRTVLSQLGASSGAAPAWLGSRLLTLAHWSGLLVTLLLAACWVSVLYHVVFGALFEAPPSPLLHNTMPLQFGSAWQRLGLIAVGVFGFLLATAQQVEFANLSSLHRYYRSRIVRGWLGAANVARFTGVASTLARRTPEPGGGYQVRDVRTVTDGDDVGLAEYSPHTGGGPVHLINVCLNQTQAAPERVFNRDRKGQMLTVMPGARMRVAGQGWQDMPEGNALTLGSWTAISGAAFAPGLGALTRSGISALAMFAGVRLGYWWQPKPPLRPWLQRLLDPFAKSRLLVSEMLGRFSGDATATWYLSDGGHFENTGVYALLRERCRLIVLADCGADPHYRFEDLENLVRKARVDLGAEIRFLKPAQADLAAPYGGFGSLSDLASDHSNACLALADISYADGATAHLVLVKPNLSSGLPVDLQNFKASNPDFPQQTTADQSYDEAQWESHFVLGREIGQWLTQALLQELASDRRPPFVPDDGKPLKASADSGKQDSASRLPMRLGVSAVSASIGLGSAATVGVAMWQAIDSVRSTSRQGSDADDKALKELTDLWGRMATPAAAVASSETVSVTSRAAAAGPLASSLLRIGDTLCPSGFKRWFAPGKTAQRVLDDARYACQDLQTVAPSQTPSACVQLLQISDARHCLYRPPDLVPGTAQRPPCLPHYWGRDYRLQPNANVVGNCPKQPLSTAKPAAQAGSSPQATTSATAAAGPGGTLVGLGSPVGAAGPAVAATSPSAPGSLASCQGNTVYLQVYGSSRREDEAALRQAFLTLGKPLAPTEDMNASAALQHRPPPTPVRVDTVRWQLPAGKDCAQAIALWLNQANQARSQPPRAAVAEALGQQYQSKVNVVEVWLAP